MKICFTLFCLMLVLISCEKGGIFKEEEKCYTCDLVVDITITGPQPDKQTHRSFHGIYCGDKVNTAKKAAAKTSTKSYDFGIRTTTRERLECKLNE